MNVKVTVGIDGRDEDFIVTVCDGSFVNVSICIGVEGGGVNNVCIGRIVTVVIVGVCVDLTASVGEGVRSSIVTVGDNIFKDSIGLGVISKE